MPLYRSKGGFLSSIKICQFLNCFFPTPSDLEDILNYTNFTKFPLNPTRIATNNTTTNTNNPAINLDFFNRQSPDPADKKKKKK